MPETQETHEWVPLEGRDLILGVRDILDRNPGRHDQRTWFGNVFYGEELRVGVRVPADQVREFMYEPIPLTPGDTEAMLPPCGSTGCAFGWAAVLSAPSGSFVSNGRIYLPDWSHESIVDWVTKRMGIDEDQASYMYSPSHSTEYLIRILDALAEDITTNVRFIDGY